MHAVPGQRVEVAGEGRDEGFAFAGFHFADLALVQHHAADQLHVEVPHLHRAPTRLAHHRKGLGQNLFQGCIFSCLDLFRVRDAFETGRNPHPELCRFGPQLLIGELLDTRLKFVDYGHQRREPLDNALIRGTKNFSKDFIEPHRLLHYQCKCRGVMSACHDACPRAAGFCIARKTYRLQSGTLYRRHGAGTP